VLHKTDRNRTEIDLKEGRIVEPRTNTDAPRNQDLYREAKRLIPGGTQLLSKRPEMFAPDQWPPYYREAHGCEVVDLDGRSYVDMSIMGVGACLLGYNHPEVTAAVIARVQAGSMATLNCPEEVELARLLVELHPWAENVRYVRTGGEAMAVAVRIARAATGRDLVAFCGYHGWHDWYLAANRAPAGSEDRLQGHLLPGLSPRGVPSQLAGTALPFAYNQLDPLAEIVRREGPRVAAVVMEPTRSVEPAPGFLEGVRELCDQSGAVLVFDEITIGWRLALGGAHLRFGVAPDIAVFAKALGNGHPMAAVIGRARVMQAAQESFISSTYWTEGVGLAAALATVRKFCSLELPAHLAALGTRFRQGLAEIAARHGVRLKLAGYPALTTLAFDYPDALALQTLLTVRMLKHGILAGPGFYPCLAHGPEHVDQYLTAADEVFAELAEAIRCGDAAARIGGPVRHSGFARLA
jgi:glutamate-1-semialdehyde 2,1-aminomutase